MAYVIAEQDVDFAFKLKDRTGEKNPHNGYIGLFYPKITFQRKYGIKEGSSQSGFEEHILTQARRVAWAKVSNTWSWSNVETEHRKNREVDEFAGNFDAENSALRQELARTKEKLEEAEQERYDYKLQCESLRETLSQNRINDGLILPAEIKEFFTGEQYDLIVGILEAAILSMNAEHRDHELLSGILQRNKIKGEGLPTLDAIEQALKDGGDRMGPREFAQLERYGFKIVSDNKHYKLIYKDNPKYQFTIDKTASDHRTTLNIISDITKKISVYKKDSMDRILLHSDCNNFYASVEGILNPAYRDIPIAVCGDPAKRHGIVLAKNMLAKQTGVKTGDTVWQAMRKCPGLTCVAPHFDKYAEYSDRIFNLYVRFTDRVEPFGNDEAWLDATNSQKLFGSGPEIAEKIRQLVKSETGLTVSIGVSFNKTFSKLGSDMKKPDAVTVITRENYREKIWPLPASDMLNVGRSTAEKLAKIGINTIGALAAADEDLLNNLFGIIGPRLKRAAAGFDDEPVRLYNDRRITKSVGHGTTSAQDMTSEDEIRKIINYLSDMVASRLRRYGMKALSVGVAIRTSDFTDSSRRIALGRPTSNGSEIARAAFDLVWKQRPGPLRALTVFTFNLITDTENEQLTIFDTEKEERSRRLDSTFDKLRKKYGSAAILRADNLYHDYAADMFDDEEAGFLPFKR